MSTKENILSKLSRLIDENDLKKNKKEIESLFEELKDASGENSDNDESSDVSREDEAEDEKSEEQIIFEKTYNELLAKFKEQKKQAKLKKINEKQTNLQEKKDLLDEMRKLIQEEENIGKAYAKVAAIHKRWKEIGDIPVDEYHEIQNEYGKLNETFYYNIDIYKELKEHDLKKNYSLKNQVLHRLDELQKEKHIKTVEKELNKVRNEWDEIGPTFKEKWEELRKEYWEKVRSLYDKISNHYEKEKEKREKNQAIKEDILERTKEIVNDIPQSHKAWSKQTNKIKKLQQKWKKTGGGPRKAEEALWKEFRAVCDKFFGLKSDFYAELREENQEHKAEKEKLVEKVQALKDSTDWDSTTEKVIQLQKKWKKIGNAGPKHEYKLWNDFRDACDHFFNAKKAHFAKKEKEASKNVEDKEKVLKSLQELKPSDPKEAVKEVKSLIEAFVDAGEVPSRLQAKMHKGFESEVRKTLEKADVDGDQIDDLYFQAKIENIKLSSIPEKLIDREIKNTRKTISRLKDELIQYENNMGFFSNSKGAEKLLGDVKEKMERNEERIEHMKERLKVLRNLEV